MLKPHSGQDATGPDVRQNLGGLDDGTVVAILRLHPTVAQIEEVRLRLNGGDMMLSGNARSGVSLPNCWICSKLMRKSQRQVL